MLIFVPDQASTHNQQPRAFPKEGSYDKGRQCSGARSDKPAAGATRDNRIRQKTSEAETTAETTAGPGAASGAGGGEASQTRAQETVASYGHFAGAVYISV